jgi:GTP-binding protein LepA
MKEIGYFSPQPTATSGLDTGEIGYLATGFKEAAKVKIGDTVAQSSDKNPEPLPGYREIAPVVFISFYPDGTSEFDDLKRGFERLRLTDAALSFEPDSNEALGRGLKVGFLGQLHFEITAARLTREFNLEFLTSFPSIAYRVREKNEFRIVKDAHEFPDTPEYVLQPMINVEILTPNKYLNTVMSITTVFDFAVREIENMDDNALVRGVMPLAELIRDFDDQLKSASAGYASFSYELGEEAPAEVEKLEILVAGDVASALTRVVPQKDLEHEARTTVERLKEVLPAQQFTQALQARSRGRIIARETIAAMKKDVTGYLYGGDRTRKMKLWRKQKRGKERLKESGRVHVPIEVFREILKK